MEEKEKRAIDIENMFEICVIKDEHGEDGYSLGTYKDRQALSGFYIKAKKDSLLEKVEGFFCGKFKLENDPENYRQEARIELWLSIDKYYNKLGYDDTVKGDGLIFTNCKYKAMDMAKLAKGNVSVCDRTTGKYYINKIESFEQKFIEENDKMRNQKDEKYLSEKYNIEDFNKVFTGEYETTNEFIRWFEKNKSYILTKKQIDYLNGDAIIKNASGVWIINKNIRKRVESCYANDKLKKERIELCKNVQDNSSFNFGSVFCICNYKIMKMVSKLSSKNKKGIHFSNKTNNWLCNDGSGDFKQAIKLINRVKKIHKLFNKKIELEVRVWE